MKRGVVLIEIRRLKAHEAVNQKKVKELMGQIKRDGHLRNPVVVDRKSLVILDGHHRVAGLEKLGFKRMPVFLVDYMSDQVKVYLRKNDLTMRLIKESVLRMGRSKKVFPVKTTRHLIKNRIKGINLGLKKIY